MFVVVFAFVIKSTVTYLYILYMECKDFVFRCWYMGDIFCEIRFRATNKLKSIIGKMKQKYMSSTSCAVQHVKGTEETTKFYGWSNKISVV